MDRHFAFGVISFLVMIFFSFYVALNVWDTDSKGEIQIEESLISPDRNYIATLWNEMGGGAAGWCFRYLSIGGKNISSKTQIESDEKVFSLNCSSEVEFSWINNSQLQIKYKFVEKYEKIFFQKSNLENGEISIRYVTEK